MIPDDPGNFIWQQKKENGSFLGKSEKKANLNNASRKRLRVSDDWQMAIQDTDLSEKQPKNFYASDTVFQDSQNKLLEVKSHFELYKTSKVLTVWDGNSVKRVLTQLLPRHKVEPEDDPLTLRDRQDCDSMSESVTGRWVMEMYPTSGHQLGISRSYTRVNASGLTQLASLVAKLMGKSGDRRREIGTTGSEQESYRVAQSVAVEYVQALTSRDAGALDRILQSLKINQYASPDVGDSFVIGSLAEPDKERRITDLMTGKKFVPKWPYHYAGVVAKSGSDTVTLENYARGAEQVGNRAKDPRWYFQMYGRGEGQSFHEANIALGGYANPVTTALHSKVRTKQAAEHLQQQQQLQQRRATFMRQVKVGVTGIAITIGLLAIILSVLRRFGYI